MFLRFYDSVTVQSFPWNHKVIRKKLLILPFSPGKPDEWLYGKEQSIFTGFRIGSPKK